MLGNKPYVPAGAPAVSVMNGERDRMVDKTDDIGPEKITLALNILGEFDFSGHYLLDLVKEFVVRYLDHEVSLIRIGSHFFFSFLFFSFLFVCFFFCFVCYIFSLLTFVFIIILSF